MLKDRVGLVRLNEDIHRVLTSARMLGVDHEDVHLACGAQIHPSARNGRVAVRRMRKLVKTGLRETSKSRPLSSGSWIP